MQDGLAGARQQELFSAEEIALAAGVDLSDVQAILQSGLVVSFRQFVAPPEAVALVRRLSRGESPDPTERSPLTVVPPTKRRSGLSLFASSLVHVTAAFMIGYASLSGWLSPNDTEQDIRPLPPARIVYLMSPGPGGGGGGGGLRMPTAAPAAMRKAPTPLVLKTASPVVPVRRPPPVRSTARLPQPVPPPRVEPKPIDVPRPAPSQVVQAPVVPVPADPVDTAGVLASRSTAPSAGPGVNGGVGVGVGTGLGEGDGSGLGSGTGGGTGGGPFHPGSGIEPPSVIREVRPSYTDEARRARVEGDVVLEIVVLRDGRVGNIRTIRSLGAGLDQRAADAVRQWRFTPARRQGVPVDVVVQVSVGFKLR